MGNAKLFWSGPMRLVWPLFSVMGAQVAMAQGAHPVVVVIMGMITGTFGELLRDIVCNEVPLLLM